MLELNPKTTPTADPKAAPAAADLIRDVTDATFVAEVIDLSQTVPVIVDFWATWCGPCKTLGPVLERAVAEAGGKVRLAKVDVDRSQQVAAQLRIQSIPTVYAFWKGQPVDGFQGALQTSEVKRFVDKIAALAGDGGLSEALDEADAMLAEGAAVDAAQIYAAILEEDPKTVRAYAGLVRAHLALGDADQAEAILNGVPAELSTAPEIDAVHAQIALARQAASAGPLAELEARVSAEPGDLQARFDYATALHAAGKVKEAVDQLLELFRRDREWNEGAAKAQLFTIFEALNPNDPVALAGRRRLSSMIFA